MTLADPAALVAALDEVGQQDADAINLTETALMLAALARPGLSLDRYRQQLTRLTTETEEQYQTILATGVTGAQAKVQALQTVLAINHGFTGDRQTYNDLQNADLLSVLDRRKGMPITLALIYLHIARGLGWIAHGLNFPGHFLVRLDEGPERLLLDPFAEGAILQAADLRAILKKTLGPDAELSITYYEPADNRAILIRLQNNIKTRLIEAEDYEGALHTVETMRRIAPDEYRLLLDAGVLQARTRRLEAALITLETYIKQAPDDRDRHDAALLLQQIKQLLN